MGFPLYYPPADTKSQNFVKKYPGRTIKPHILVLHTMEVNGWPGYSNGGVAPHLSLRIWLNKDGSLAKYAWRQHFPFNRTARAVRNLSGGVETNNSTQGVIQVELAGTCGWAKNVKPNWSDPDQLRKIAEPLIEFIVFCNEKLGIELVAPYKFYKWNGSGHRMTSYEWLKFKGICGHQHVPENIHIDPGAIDIDWLLKEAKKRVAANSDSDSGSTDDGSSNSNSDYQPAQIKVTGKFDTATIKALQYITGLRGDDIDGIWGPQSKKRLQKWLIVKQDGVVGPQTVKALQKRIAIPAAARDGKWGTQTTTYLQNYLNKKIAELAVKN